MPVLSDDKRLQHSVMLVAIGKTFSAYSTYLIGEYQFKLKADFKAAVGTVDRLITSIEKDLGEENKELLEHLSEEVFKLFEQLKVIE